MFNVFAIEYISLLENISTIKLHFKIGKSFFVHWNSFCVVKMPVIAMVFASIMQHSYWVLRVY